MDALGDVVEEVELCAKRANWHAVRVVHRCVAIRAFRRAVAVLGCRYLEVAAAATDESGLGADVPERDDRIPTFAEIRRRVNERRSFGNDGCLHLSSWMRDLSHKRILALCFLSVKIL